LDANLVSGREDADGFRNRAPWRQEEKSGKGIPRGGGPHRRDVARSSEVGKKKVATASRRVRCERSRPGSSRSAEPALSTRARRRLSGAGERTQPLLEVGELCPLAGLELVELATPLLVETFEGGRPAIVEPPEGVRDLEVGGARRHEGVLAMRTVEDHTRAE